MLFNTEQLQEISSEIDLILNKISEFENTYQSQIQNAHPNYKESAKNLIHYFTIMDPNMIFITDVHASSCEFKIL